MKTSNKKPKEKDLEVKDLEEKDKDKKNKDLKDNRINCQDPKYKIEDWYVFTSDEEN